MKIQAKLMLVAVIAVVVIFSFSGYDKGSAGESKNTPDTLNTLNRLSPPTFTNVSEMPALSNGLPGEWDEKGAWWPSVIKDGDTLRMWYTGRDTKGIFRIGYAWSLDGQNWNKHAANPVLAASLSWELSNVGECEVIKDSATFKMWYSTAKTKNQLFTKIGYASSIDGIHWTKHSDAVMEIGTGETWEDQRIGVCTVIKDNGSYKMWYWGGTDSWVDNDHEEIGYATSSDGISWIKHGRAVMRGEAGQWDSQRTWGAAVVKVSSDLFENTDDRYEMVYSGANAPVPTQWLGYASSDDGKVWVKSSKNPIVKTPPGFGSNYYSSEMLKFNGEYHLWFTSWDVGGDNKGRIGYAKGKRK